MDANEPIVAVLQGLLSGIDADSRKLGAAFASCERVQDALRAVREHKPGHFRLYLSYPLEQLVDGVLSEALQGHGDACFLFAHADFVEHHFEYLIVRHEGRPCSADKSRTLLSALARHFACGEDIVFNYAQPYTYHLPKRVFKEHAEIAGFFKAVQSLYYGRPEAYLLCLQAIESRLAAEQTGTDSH